MSKQRVTMKDISSYLGVSLGVIHKVLNNKEGVSPQMREKVLAATKELGYTVNKVAQTMARNTIVIGVIIPSEWEDYFSILQKGIDSELVHLLDYNVMGKYYVVENIYSSINTTNVINQCIEDNVHGIILCDFFPFGIGKTLKLLEEKNIPLVIIGDAQSTNNRYFCSIQVDAYCSGKMAAEMLYYLTHDDANVAIFVGNKDNIEHKLKIQGFVDNLNNYNLNLVGVYETLDDELIMKHLFERINGETTNLHGIYSATSNFNSTGEYIMNNNLDIKIVCTDMNKQLAYFMKNNIVQCSIYQNLEKQGITAVRVLYEYIANHKETDKVLYIKPQLIIRSNLDSYIK